jgi:thiamine biosynthesis protein ThiI
MNSFTFNINILTILVAYSEIALKGKYVRRKLESALVYQIRYQLERNGYTNSSVERRFGRIIIDGVPSEAAVVISKVFGVANTMASIQTDTSKSSVIETLVKLSRQSLNGGNTFAVRPKVIGDHPYGSRELAVDGGSAILEALSDKDISVNLTSPDITFFIEVRDTNSYLYTNILPGVLGLPYGTQGKAVGLLSGGIDSPVAIWQMMKRGISVLPLFMDQTPYVGKNYIVRAKKSFKKIMEYVPESGFQLFSVPMGPIMQRLLESENLRLTCILCKRSMYRIAEHFSVRKKAKTIITGESLGQVASQTLSNLYTLTRAVTIPVLRPNIGLDKVEIENIARRIGTYDITAKKVEGCKCVPSNPVTKSRLDVVKTLEEELNLLELCNEAANNIEVIV